MDCNLVNKKIGSDTVEFIIFYKHLKHCSYSNNAVKLLKEKHKSFKGYCVKNSDINVDYKNDLIQCLKQTTDSTNFDINHNTLPIIFRNGKFVGGYTELLKLLQN